MSRSSPARRSQLLSSPDRKVASRFLLDDRNNEVSHRDALAAAQLEHDRVRKAAIRVYELHELQIEHQRIVDEERREEERLKTEALIVAEEQRLRELRAKTIPRPPPEPPRSPTPPPPVKSVAPAKTNGTTPTKESKPPASTTPPSEVKKVLAAPPSSLPNKPPPTNPFQKTNGLAAPQPTAAPAAPVAAPTAQPARSPTVDQYSQIHQELKKLRKELQSQSKVAGSPLKGKMGTFRREIRVSIGQLTSGRGANAVPVAKITAALRASLDGKIPSPLIDVSLFVVDKRHPVEGAINNDATMPSLFIYLMNICAKGIINQFINEAGANTKAADPVGVFTAQIFSQKDFQWRGQSLIDILMAKYRIACPVLFGHRGNDKTERGRIALGWKKDGTSWITEQNHNDRMTGLGAGFASLSLRDFSKTTKTNPYPPVNYWKALAGIVNSPANETSNTQYVVLRAMIEGHEQRFLSFYGNAAFAALRLALIEFPKKAPETANAAGSLRALADILKTEVGLVLV
ncbi:GLE1-like protein-domain-containing protein [Ilyonectria robusta]|uniref:GLE1-like protein-domain-containing protein n=1 Tax=Ilyonectria robusta TaxID=1079257 RepID=UPI001E8E7AE1|nr:GLE1-like protein-domain-containing protein [Ilyonectria robusta]KAH8733615.1 GLE1-like protein-domain-containing protein [Ilyonectria robusta]